MLQVLFIFYYFLFIGFIDFSVFYYQVYFSRDKPPAPMECRKHYRRFEIHADNTAFSRASNLFTI